MKNHTEMVENQACLNILTAWAQTVQLQGTNPVHSMVFDSFYKLVTGTLRPTLRESIIRGFGKENAQKGRRNSQTVNVRELVYSDNLDMDIINEFMLGISYCKTTNDALAGRNLTLLVSTILTTGTVKDALTLLKRQITNYAAHYFRHHYSELVVSWGNESFSIDDDNCLFDPSVEMIDFVGTSVVPYYTDHGIGLLYHKIENLIASGYLQPQEQNVVQSILDLSRSCAIIPIGTDMQQRRAVYEHVAKLLNMKPTQVGRVFSNAVAHAKKRA